MRYRMRNCFSGYSPWRRGGACGIGAVATSHSATVHVVNGSAAPRQMQHEPKRVEVCEAVTDREQAPDALPLGQRPFADIVGADETSALPVAGECRQDGGRGRPGQVAVIFALLLVVLIGMVGLAVDVAHARSVAEDVEAAAQAAALAGVPYLPESIGSTPAETTALSVAAANGYANGGITSVVPTAYSDTRRLKVTITTKVAAPFLNVFGLGSVTVSRSAIASYSDPIETGAPDHVLGFAPYPTTAFNAVAGLTGYYPQGFYLEIRGSYTGLEHGDAYSPYFETAKGDYLVEADGAQHTYVQPCTSEAAVNGTPAPSYNNVCLQLTQVPAATPTAPTAVPPAPTYTPVPTYTPSATAGPAALAPNPYYNQNNAGDGQLGYNYVFTLPPNMPSDGSHQVLLKVLDPLDECALSTTAAESTAIPTSTPSSSSYYFTNRNSSYLMQETSTGVVQNKQDNVMDVQWQKILVSGNTYYLRSDQTGQYLEASSSSTVTLNSSFTGSTKQQWTFTLSGGYYTIVNVNYSVYLDVQGSSKSTGASIILASSSGSKSQQWTQSSSISFSYQYEGTEAYYSGSFGSLSTSGWGAVNTTKDYSTVFAALDGSGVAPDPTATPAVTGTPPTLISEGTTMLDQCTSGYYGQDYPTTLEFQIFQPSLRAADNTTLVSAGSVNQEYSGAYITVGSNPIYAGPEWQAQPVNANCTGTCTLVGTHASHWLTIGRAYNPSSVPVYIRVNVQVAVDSAYYSSHAEYGSAWSTHFGDGGNVFALGLCDTTSTGVSSYMGTQLNTDTETDPYASATAVASPTYPYPANYGDIFNSSDWEAADTTGLDPDKGCPDPNLDTAFTSASPPVVTSTAPIFRFQVNGRDGMCIITLTTASSGNVTDYIPLAELGSRFAGSTVTVRLFDAGDVSSASNYISILGPTDNPASSNFTSGNYTSTEYANAQGTPVTNAQGTPVPYPWWSVPQTNAQGTPVASPAPESFASEPYHLDIASPPNTNYSNSGTNRPPWWCNNFTGGSDYSADNPPAGRTSWCPPVTKNPIDQGVQVSNNGDNSFANDVWLEFQITLPSSYSPTSGKDWWKVAYNLTGLSVGSHADDTTTWQLASSSAPVQLITAQ